MQIIYQISMIILCSFIIAKDNPIDIKPNFPNNNPNEDVKEIKDKKIKKQVLLKQRKKERKDKLKNDKNPSKRDQSFFDENHDQRKKRPPELQALIDELRKDFNKEREMLNNEHRNKMLELKEKFKIKRKNLINDFKSNNKPKERKKRKF